MAMRGQRIPSTVNQRRVRWPQHPCGAIKLLLGTLGSHWRCWEVGMGEKTLLFSLQDKNHPVVFRQAKRQDSVPETRQNKDGQGG